MLMFALYVKHWTLSEREINAHCIEVPSWCFARQALMSLYSSLVSAAMHAGTAAFETNQPQSDRRNKHENTAGPNKETLLRFFRDV